MAEYYAVLSKAVAGLETSTPESRRAVYDKARNALIGQLKAIDPPLPTSEISRQRLELEEAIRRVERETAATPAVAPVRTAPQRPVAAPVQEPQVAPQPAPQPVAAGPVRPSPQDVFRRAIQDAEGNRKVEPRLAPAAAARVDTSWASERVDRVPPPARPAKSFLPSQGYVEEVPRSDEPTIAPNYDEDWDQKGQSGAPLPPDPRLDTRDRPARAKRGRRDDRMDDHDAIVERARPSRLPMLLLGVLIVAMLGGLGAIAYSQRAMISDILASMDSGSAPPAAPPVVDTPESTSSKDQDSLLGQSAPAVAVAPADDVRVVTPPGVEPAAPATSPGSSVAAAETGASADALVAQRAILYEEPLDSGAAASGVVAINAAVTWSFNPQGINGPEIVGNVDVPERGMKIKMSVRRNTDSTLPASHIVEVVVDTPADFPGRAVRDVPRLVLKASEEARGQPLIGASAKVADGFFWIALSGVDTDVNANLNLLRERSWIDLPLVYETGQRAILTFEKGNPGERVFERALAAWAG